MSAARYSPELRHYPQLDEAWQDFILSRKTDVDCSPETLKTYRFTAGKFCEWLRDRGITEPTDIEARHVRAYLSALRDRGLKSSTRNTHARSIKTMVRFWHREDWIAEPVEVNVPKVRDLDLPYLNADELRHVLREGCGDARDTAAVLLLADTGLRRAEACALKWGDVDFDDQSVFVRRSKGGESRMVFFGPDTARALLKLRRTIPHDDNDPVFRSKRGGGHLAGQSFRNWFRRIGKRAGIRLTPHAMRRTFATLSLNSGMDSLHLQRLLGHSSLEMVRRYAQMANADLKRAHEQNSPVAFAMNGRGR